jgi:hypothetical protein
VAAGACTVYAHPVHTPCTRLALRSCAATTCRPLDRRPPCP